MKKLWIFLILTLSMLSLQAQRTAENVDFSKLAKDIVITKKLEDNMKQVLLLPKEYWPVVLGDSRFTNSEMLNEIVSIFEDYLVVGIIDANVSPFGGLSSNEVALTLIDEQGEEWQPLTNDEMGDDLSNMIQVLRPAMANMLGNIGEQLQFFVFRNINTEGDEIFAATKKGKMVLKLNGEDFLFRTPFAALVEPKYCPEDNEELNGSWEYCPWHGKILEYK